jgi:hypothetical protein
VSGRIVLREADGTERVIGGGGILEFPAISSAADAVAFGAWNYGGDEDTIRVFRLNSGGVEVIGRGSIPLWGPDDLTMTYTVRGTGIVRRRLDGGNDQELLVPHHANIFPYQWLDDGRTLLYGKVTSGVASPLNTYTVSHAGRSTELLQGSSTAVSWGERMIAWCTWPAGVYVADYPGMRATTVVSESGCIPKWGRDDAVLYFQDHGRLWSTDIAQGDGVVLGERRIEADLGVGGVEEYDLHRSGLLVYVHHTYQDPKPPVIVSGWQSLLLGSAD